MRKLCLLGLILGLVAVPGLVMAAPMGLTGKQLKQGQFAMGLTGGYVFEHQFAVTDLVSNYKSGGQDTGRIKSKFKDDQRYMLQFAYGVSDRAALYVAAGTATNGAWAMHNLDSNQRWNARLKNSFVWAVGGQTQIWKLPNGIGLDLVAQYLRFDDRKLKDWTNDTIGWQAGEAWAVQDKIDFYWQAEVLARMAWTLGMFTPYVGAGWSHAEAKFTGSWTGVKGNPDSVDYNAQLVSDDELLTTAGVEVALRQNLSLTLEGRFLAETEAGLGLNWQF
ncbi:MAG: hypothetical protein V1797_11995 [Pseudomonadota bacterium]